MSRNLVEQIHPIQVQQHIIDRPKHMNVCVCSVLIDIKTELRVHCKQLIITKCESEKARDTKMSC